MAEGSAIVNDLQAIIHARTGVVVAPVTRPATPRTSGEQAALDHARKKRAAAAGLQGREWRRALGNIAGMG